MRESYLLLEEPWIPVVDLEGKRQYLGIRPLLERAHTLKAISDASPLVEYGLYRLLCVFLMDALRPEDETALEELLDEGQFNMEAIDRYIALCRQEGMIFDLFDEERPFLQTPYCAAWDKVLKPANVLDYTVPSGNNHIHFDHRTNEKISFSYDQAARLLPAALIFCTAGLQGPSNVNGAPPYFTIIQGENLFGTLIFSLLDVSLASSVRAFDNPPVHWRNQSPIEPKKPVYETSWLYGMLFPARRILLIPEAGSKTVRQIYLGAGLNFEIVDNWTDPHVTYHPDKQKRTMLKPNPEKAIWRNLNDFIDLSYAPQIVRQYQQLTMEKPLDLRIYGVQTSNANYLTSVCCDMRIPRNLLGDSEMVDLITKAIKSSEQLAAALKKVMQPPDVWNTSGSAKDSRPLISYPTMSQAVQAFYDSCGRELWNLCGRLGQSDQDTGLLELYGEWLDMLLREARLVLDQTLQTVQLDGRGFLAIAKAQGNLGRTIQKLKKEVHL